MSKQKIAPVVFFLMAFILSGCVVRTYSVYKERSDLDLNSGNRGYLQGKTTQPATVAKPNRENKVIEIEVFPLIKSLKRGKSAAAIKKEADKENETVQQGPEIVIQPPVLSESQEYTVGQNDTLQKISQKFYGSMHKWTKIYEANKDKLKGPDKIKPGQVLRIPADTQPKAIAVKAEKPKEPVENLK